MDRETVATTPPSAPARPGAVTAAGVVWLLVGAGLVVVGALFLVALAVPDAADPGTSGLALVASTLLLLAGGVVAVAGAAVLLRRTPPVSGRRAARAALTVLGVLLAVVGVVQLTFRGVGGSWFVAALAGVVLLHVPAARRWFAPGRAP